MDNNTSPTNSLGQTPPPQITNARQASSNDPPSQPQDNLPAKNHRQLSPTTIGIIGAIIGLAIGAVVMFGIMKALEKSTEECPKCNLPANTSAVTGDINFDFLKMEASSNNMIYSPLSIRNGLGLLSAGASGTTKTEIDKVLGDTPIPKYNTIPNKLSLANAVFIRDTYQDKVLPSYTEIVQNDYDGEVLYDDFKSSANMDNWVKDKTFNLIDSIGIQPDQDLRMVLANALAIQMDWKHQFDDDDTGGQTFYKSDGSEIQATTMHRESHDKDVQYYVDDNTTAIALPLTSDAATPSSGSPTSDDVHLDFIAIMPSDIDAFVKEVGTKDIDELVSKMTPASEPKDGLIYYIPKYKYDYKLNFENDLKALGMNLAFDKYAADFSKMSSEPLYVGDAIHKANIDFSEKGIKAAAVTAFAMALGTAREDEKPKPVVIKIDRPFVFVIRDADNGTIWFTGTVYEPNLWEDDMKEYRPSYDY